MTSIDEAVTTSDQTGAGWFTDPLGEHRMRYFDGANWTAHVTHFGPTPCRHCRLAD